ncbi:hypothetical protein JW823_03690 [bacterium]|nr:hypothetical protein [candidate division CSSED10-310 bacterium]
MNIDPDRKKAFDEYLDDILPDKVDEPHPFKRFQLNEIVRHDEWGTGVVTGFRIPDLDREIEGLGVQFVVGGRMMAHRVFTPKECGRLSGSRIIYDIAGHAGMTLEDILNI